MKHNTKIPVKIPLENDGSISDVITDFINKMEEITGGNVELECDLQGNITIFYESRPNKNNRLTMDELETLYRGESITGDNEKLIAMDVTSKPQTL